MVDETRTSAGGSTSGQPVKQELKQDANRLKDQALTRAKDEAGTRKDQAAQTASAASSALDKAASELRNDENAPDWLAGGIERLAKNVSGFADSIQSKDMDEIGRDVSRFARQNPGTFLAACAAAGFAAARFLRVGAEEKGYLADHSSSGRQSFRTAGSTSYGGATTGTGTGMGTGTGTGTTTYGSDGYTGTGTITGGTAGSGSSTGPASTYGAGSTGGFGGGTQGGAS